MKMQLIAEENKYVIIIPKRNGIISYNIRKEFRTEREAIRYMKYLKRQDKRDKEIFG